MSDINTLFLTGHVVRDAVLAYTQAGTPLTDISVAVNRTVKKGNEYVSEPHFFDVAVWGKTAENLAQYLVKGKKIALTGRLAQQKWTAQDGTQRQKVCIVADNIQLASSAPAQNQQQNAGQWQPQPQQQPKQNARYQQAYKQNPPQTTPDMYNTPEADGDYGFPEEIPF